MTRPPTNLANLCYDLALEVGTGVISTGEAIRRVVAEPAVPSVPDVAALAGQFWDVARSKCEQGSLAATLLHEWAAVHAADDPQAVFFSGLTLVRAATEVLIARDDAALYRRACAAASRMLAMNRQAAEYAAGMLRLAAYAYDPVDAPGNYALGPGRRVLRETSQPIYVPRTRTMPDALGELDHAIAHLRSAATHATGRSRGEILTHLAYAAHSRHLAGGGPADPADLDRWCAEAATLLPPVDTPLANNRLILLCLLRQRGELIAGRDVIGPAGVLPDGLMHTVLTGITAVRVLDICHGLDGAGPIARATHELVRADPELTAQRGYLALAAGHSLPGDPFGCAARRHHAVPPPSRLPAGAAPAADRIHALLCGPRPDDVAILEAVNLVREHAPHLSMLVKVIVGRWNWLTASDALRERDPRAILLLVHAVMSLIKVGDRETAMLALDAAHRRIGDGLADVDTYELGAPLNAMAALVFAHLPEASRRIARECLWLLVAHWTTLDTPAADEWALVTMTLAKGPGLTCALARPGPLAPDADLAGALAGIPAEHPTEHPTEQPGERREMILTGYLQSAERQPGATEQQRAANLRRRAQRADVARLMARAADLPIRAMDAIRASLPDDAALFTIYTGGLRGPADTGGLRGPDDHAGVDGVRMVLLPRRGTMYVAGANFARPPAAFPGTRDYVQTALAEDGAAEGGVAVHSSYAARVTSLRRAVLAEPLHGEVSRQGAQALALLAERLLINAGLEPLLDAIADAGHTRLLVWPHEALYFLPLQLVPFRDGILADRFTVTVLPSTQCLIDNRTFAAAGPGVTAIASATGGTRAGLPVEPSVHRQAERIAALFGQRPLIGEDATPAAALRAIGTTRYLHLAAHGTQDVDAPLFARVYLAGGAVHAHEILTKDLRGTELVTLSACESALLRYDFLDNGHGLAPAFLRAGARAVIGAVWPVTPDTAETFFTELYTQLAIGEPRAVAFRLAQHQTRARHPDYRDWGAFTYYGC